MKNSKKFYLQVITGACIKTAVLEICSEKKTKVFAVGTFKNICTGAVHCWYVKDAFAGFWKKNFEKKYFRRYFWVKLKNAFPTLSRFWPLRGWGVLMNPLTKENLRWKLSADIKADIKQEIKELVAVSYNFSEKYLLKTWNTM